MSCFTFVSIPIISFQPQNNCVREARSSVFTGKEENYSSERKTSSALVVQLGCLVFQVRQKTSQGRLLKGMRSTLSFFGLLFIFCQWDYVFDTSGKFNRGQQELPPLPRPGDRACTMPRRAGLLLAWLLPINTDKFPICWLVKCSAPLTVIT